MTISRASAALAVIAATAILLAAAGDARQADPGVQLRAAIEKEDVAGDLEGAMALYRQIIAANGRNRAVTAKAILRLAGCHEKLGQTEARKLYERLVAEYSDQAQEVTLARSRLAALTRSAEPQKPTFRKIVIPTKLPTGGSGKLSPDGQTLAFISEGSLWTVPVHGKSDPNITGAPIRLTEPMHAWDVANVGIEWSTDGNWIGFRVALPSSKDAPSEEEIYVVPATGGAPRRLPITWPDWVGDAYTLRYALSGGGDVLYFAAGTKLEELRIYSMPTRSGDRRALTTPMTRQPALSPDGSRIAYVRCERGEGGRLDTKEIWIASADGTAARMVYRHTGDALRWVQGPIWSPDSRMLAFLVSPRGNRFDQVLVLPVRDGWGAAAEPARFDLPVPGVSTYDILAGWTPDNRIGVLIPAERTAVYRIPASGGKAVQLTPKAGWMPAWSPDGKRIYFKGVHGGDPGFVEFVAADGGPVERLPRDRDFEHWEPSYPHGGLSASPDGQSICVAAFDSRNSATTGIYVLPAGGGRPTLLAAGLFGEPRWSLDGARIAFIRPDQTTGVSNILVLPRSGGEPRQVTTTADDVAMGSLAWSPDGRSIAFYARDNTLRVIAATGAASRVVTKVTGNVRTLGLAWSPDGEMLAYVSDGGLWRIPAAGGTPVRIETGLDATLEKIAWSPNGTSIAFSATSGGEHELWLMEDFIRFVKQSR